MVRQTVSLRKGAQALGMALSTLQHHIARGHVTLIDGKVDVEVARVQLAKYTDPDQQMRALGGKAAMRGEAETEVLPPSVKGADDARFMQEKARRERTLADLAELELAEKRGELVRRSDVERSLAGRLVAVRERAISMPDRLTARIRGAESDAEAHKLFRDEVLQMLEDLTREAPQATQ
jgi:hypothetical protein